MPVFKTVQLFLLNSGTEDDSTHPNNGFLSTARITAAALFILVSSTVILKVLDEIRHLPRRLVRKNHVVLCGLGPVGLQILDDLRDAGRAESIVVVLPNEFDSWTEYARSVGASLVFGDPTRGETLLEARVFASNEVFILGDDDSANLETIGELEQILQTESLPRGRIQVYVHLGDLALASSFQPAILNLHRTSKAEIHVVNRFQHAATKLITEQLWPYAPRDRHDVAHFVILGFGRMGQTLAHQLAQLAVFPSCKRLRITIADRDVEKTAREFLASCARFTSWTESRLGVTAFDPQCDDWSWNEHPLPEAIRSANSDAIQYVTNTQFLELPGGRSDECFAQIIASQFVNPGVKPALFVCSDEDHRNLELGLQLNEQLSRLGLSQLPIFVWLPTQSALAKAFSESSTMKAFGESEVAASYDEVTSPLRESLGQKIHEDYERRALATGDRPTEKLWENLDEHLRESNRVSADHLLIKLATLGQFPAPDVEGDLAPAIERIKKSDLQLLGEMEHYRWVSERLLAGWRWGTDQEGQPDRARKLSPDLVPWSKLGAARQKDFDVTLSVLRSIASRSTGQPKDMTSKI